MTLGTSNKPKLHIFVGAATHFLKWELEEFKNYFTLVDAPGEDVILLAFGPDVLVEAATVPARKRCIVLFPGFGHNPVHSEQTKLLHREYVPKYDVVFINNGPLQIAYKGFTNIEFYPFSVNETMFSRIKYRKRLDTLIHISNDGPQKDWQRSERIMGLTGLSYEVFPPRDPKYYDKVEAANIRRNKARRLLRISEKNYLPKGYVSHETIVRKYYKYDGFVHVAAEVPHEGVLDGKYTATLIEAGMSGALLFWHDTFNLGNDLKTVFDLPLDEKKAAEMILDIRGSVDIYEHSKRTREEMLETFNTKRSVRIRAEKILSLL
jgi:hypothetical protein